MDKMTAREALKFRFDHEPVWKAEIESTSVLDLKRAIQFNEAKTILTIVPYAYTFNMTEITTEAELLRCVLHLMDTKFWGTKSLVREFIRRVCELRGWNT
jgi:hypothetical protein